MMKELLRLERVGHSHLQDVSLILRENELLAIEAGYFKYLTELHKILSGETDYFGKIYLNNEQIPIGNTYDAIRHGLYCVGSDKLLVDNLSVKDNLLLFAIKRPYLSIIHKEKSSEEVLEYLNSFDLGAILDEMVGDLDEIKRYKLAIIKALLADAKVIVLWNADHLLESEGVDSFKKYLQIIKDKGVSIIYLSNRIRIELVDIIDQLVLLQRRATGYSFYDKERMKEYLDNDEEPLCPTKENGNLLLIGENGRKVKLVLNSVSLVDIGHDHPLLKANDPNAAFERSFQLLLDNKRIEDYYAISKSTAISSVFGNLSVKENVCFHAQRKNAKLLKIDRISNDYLYERLIEKYEYLKPLAKYHNRSDSYDLDDGILFRIELARIIMVKPKIIILINAHFEESLEGIEYLNQMIHDLAKTKGITTILFSSDSRTKSQLLKPDYQFHL